jgi:hypothetical protein
MERHIGRDSYQSALFLGDGNHRVDGGNRNAKHAGGVSW